MNRLYQLQLSFCIVAHGEYSGPIIVVGKELGEYLTGIVKGITVFRRETKRVEAVRLQILRLRRPFKKTGINRIKKRFTIWRALQLVADYDKGIRNAGDTQAICFCQ